MKATILLSLAVLAAAAQAEQSVFSVFPNAGGDLASAADWGSVPKPTGTDHVKISRSGTYSLSEDMSIASMTLSAKDVVFDFSDGNKTLTLNSEVQGWGNVMSLFQYAHDYGNPTVAFKGGTWFSASSGSRFSFVPLGTADNSHSHAVTLSDGCVITNVGAFYTSRRMSNTRTVVSGGSRLYGNSMTLYAVSGTNNVLEVVSGGSVNLSGDFACDELFGNPGQEVTAPYLLRDIIDIHGDESAMNVVGSAFVGRYARGVKMRVRDGGAVSAGSLVVADDGASSNNWLEVSNGGSVSSGVFRCVGHHNVMIVSNATFRVGSASDFSLGYKATSHDNSMRVIGGSSVFDVKPGSKDDVLARNYFGYGNTFSLEGGAQWCPARSQMSFCVMSNNVFRLSGSGTMFDNSTDAQDGTYRSVYIGLAHDDSGNSKASLSNSWNNVIEILDGATLRANRFFVHGFNNRVIVSNATLVAGSIENAARTSGFGVWIGRGASSKCAIVLRGTTPQVRPRYASYPRALLLQNGAVLRYEIPEEGYPDGHVAVQMKELTSAGWSSANKIEVDCAEWARRSDSENRTLVLFRGSSNLSNSADFRNWFNGQNLNLPANVTCYLKGTDIVLHRKRTGLQVILK